MKEDYIVFLDFDGTVTTRDVGYEMIRKFTGSRTQPIVDKYRRGEVNSYVCLKTECEIWNSSPPDENEVYEFLESQSVAPGLKVFLELINNEKIHNYLISEGFDFYIDPILSLNGLSDLDRITNKASFKNGMIMPEFPYLGKGCGECSSCKGYHIKRMTDPRAAAVFIGDGHSDIHGAAAADIVFAKSFLKESLEKSGRYYFEYDDFFDIIEVWEAIFYRNLFSCSERISFCRISEKRRSDFEKLWETGEVMKYVGYPDGLGWSRQNYDKFWQTIGERDFILLAIEDKTGNFLGEAKLAFPDEDGYCNHDVKILPEFQGQGYGKKAWRLLMELSGRRWANAIIMTTPNIQNAAAINLYKSLGFEFDGDEREWIPQGSSRGLPVRYRAMIKP